MTRMEYLIEIGILARTWYRVETDQGGMHITLPRYTYRHQVHSKLSLHPTVFIESLSTTELCVCVFERRLGLLHFGSTSTSLCFTFRVSSHFRSHNSMQGSPLGLLVKQRLCCDCILLASLRLHPSTATWCCVYLYFPTEF